MLPLLPSLAMLAGRGVAGRAISGVGSRLARGAKTATRQTSRRSLAMGAGGATTASMAMGSEGTPRQQPPQSPIQQTQQNIQQEQSQQQTADLSGQMQQLVTLLTEINSKLGETGREAETTGRKLEKSLVAPLKKGKDLLGGMLKTARNIVMAVGAMAVGSFLLNTKGKIEQHANAGKGKVDERTLRGYNRAKALRGYNENEFDLGQLQTALGGADSYEIFNKLGLNRDELAQLDGMSAMEKVKEAIAKQLEYWGDGAILDQDLIKAIQQTTNVDVSNANERYKFGEKERKLFIRDYQYFIKTISDTSSLVEAQRNIAKLQYRIKDLGEKFAVTIAPYVNKVLDSIIRFIDSESNISGMGEIVDKVFSMVSSGISKLKEVFTKDVLHSILDSLASIGKSMIDIAKVIIPYFVQGLQVVASAIQNIANFLNDPKGFLKEKGKSALEFTKDIGSGALADFGQYGKNTGTFFGGITGLGNYDESNRIHNEDFDNYFKKMQEQYNRQPINVNVNSTVTLKNENGDIVGQVTSIAGGNGR